MTVASVVISTDAGLRDALSRMLAASRRPITVAAQIEVPFSQVGEEQIRRIRSARPALVFVDLERDSSMGIELTRFLADAHPEIRFVATGPVPSPELLMSVMQAGVSEYLPKPVTPEALVAALERIERKLGLGGEVRAPGRLIAFLGAKGGCGATTVATNLAINLHQLTAKPTLLADLDMELGAVALLLGIQPRFNLVDLARNFHRMDAELLASYVERHDCGVHLLAAPFQAEKEEAVRADQTRQILQFLKQNYDYVVVDAPKSFSPAALAALEQADEIYVVTVVDLPSLRNIKRSLPLLDRATGGRLRERVHLIVNRYQPDGVISIAEVQRTLGMKVHWKLANDYESVIHSINSGKPLILDGKKSPFTAGVRALGAEITGIKSPNGTSGGLGLSRLFRRSPA